MVPNNGLAGRSRGGRRLASWVMTLVGYPLTALWTFLGIALFPVLFLAWKLVTRWPAGRIMRHFIWLYGRGWVALNAPFVRFRREGLEHLRLARPSILVVNHLSFFDTYCMALLPFYDVTFAVRAWPFRISFYGFFMRLAGYLDVETFSWDEVLQGWRADVGSWRTSSFFPRGAPQPGRPPAAILQRGLSTGCGNGSARDSLVHQRDGYPAAARRTEA